MVKKWIVYYTGCGMDDRGSIAGRGRDSFLFATTYILLLGPTQPSVQSVPRHFLGVKWPGREAVH
jgi:hypothetical protein